MIDFNKPVQTRDGRKVRVICKDAIGHQPIIALLADESGNENIVRFASDGSYFTGNLGNDMDLINVPERLEQWVNIYSGNVGSVNSSRKNADESVDSFARRTGVIRITYEDGKPVAVALEDCK